MSAPNNLYYDISLSGHNQNQLPKENYKHTLSQNQGSGCECEHGS